VEHLDSKHVYTDPWLSVRQDTVRRPDGSSGVYSVVDTADCSLVIPVDGDRVHLVEQYRHPVAGRRWEFPSGSRDHVLDADATAGASRELREETGLSATTLTLLGTLDTMPSTLNQQCSVFLATGLTQHSPRRDPEEQDMRSAWFTRSQVEQLITDGTVSDAKSIAAYALLLLRESMPRPAP
jgi:8-oxo-dGTP pyrophosphatase MutT (NUDIX family)